MPLEFPATFIAGALSLIVLLRRAAPGSGKNGCATVLAVLAVTGLAISWLLVGRLGDNNDLGLRAILPAAVILIAAAAAGVVAAPPGRAARAAIAAAAFGGLILSLPDSAAMIYANWRGNAAADAVRFCAGAGTDGARLRRYAPANARIANNPLYLQDLTPWPGNMSWALLADRNSCFAGL